ncbi:MAG: hypothetical protein HQL87_09650 [Magnetococcales bacterium]|nr:hypothetical protein [Magnetococcales bacterium]
MGHTPTYPLSVKKTFALEKNNGQKCPLPEGERATLSRRTIRLRSKMTDSAPVIGDAGKNVRLRRPWTDGKAVNRAGYDGQNQLLQVKINHPPGKHRKMP